MADFEAVLRKTLDGMTDPAPEVRAKVYDRARATINRQIEAMEKRPSEQAIQRQFEKLEAAIAGIEARYAAPEAPVETVDGSDLDHLFEDDVAAPAAEPREPEPEPEPEHEPVIESYQEPESESRQEPEPEMAESWQQPEAGEEKDPLAEFLAEQEAAAHAELTAEPEIREEPRAEIRHEEPVRKPAAAPPAKAGRGPLIWIGAAVAVLLIAGIAAYAGRDTIMAMFGSSGETQMAGGVPVREVPSTTVTPEDTDQGADTGQPADAAPADETDAPEKFTQRLTSDGQEVDSGPAQSPGTEGEGTSIAGQTGNAGDQMASGDDSATAGAPAADAAGSGDQGTLPVGQRAIFYQERTGSQAGTAEAGATVWSVVQESPGGDLPPEPAIRAEASIPELDLTMEMTIRRNADETFPASHVIELLFRMPDTFEGRGIADVQRITFKGTEQDPGNALIGVAAPLDTNIFLIALTDAQTAIETNLNLMQREEWIDIPMQYVSGRRALITLEKGIPGEQVFNEVLSAWKEKENGGTPPAAQN